MKGTLSSLVADGIRKVIDGYRQLAEDVVETGISFDSSMSEVQAISDVYKRQILAKRGYRQHTSKEREFYQKLIKAGKASDPKQAFTSLLATEDAMPETIMEDVYRDRCV